MWPRKSSDQLAPCAWLGGEDPAFATVPRHDQRPTLHEHGNPGPYDAVGTRLTSKDGGALATYSYDAANQLTRSQDSTGTTTSTFDGAGSLSLTRSPTNQRTSYSWDGESWLTQVRLPSGTVNTFTY